MNATGSPDGPAAGRAAGPAGLTARGWRGRAVRARITARRPSAALRALPEFLLVGGQRCGTTSLYTYLSGHPQLRGPVLKEPQYFAYRNALGLAWYRSLFPLRAAGRTTFEASPYYLFHPLAAGRAGQVLPEAKIVVLLRDPVERAFSHYRHSVKLGVEPLSFSEALAAEPDRLAGEEDRIRADPGYPADHHRWFSYAARGHYAQQLGRWLDVYGPGRVRVLRSEDLFADPAGTFAGLLDFLGLPPYAPPQFDVVTRSRTGEAALIPAAARDRLAAEFADVPAELGTLLGRPFGWGAAGE